MVDRSHAPGPIRVLLADDREASRLGLEALLSTFEEIEVIGTAVDGHEAVRRALDLHPDVVVMEGRMAGMDGLEATRRIKALRPDIAIVVHSMFGSLRAEAARAGAEAFLVKGCSVDTLLHTLRDTSMKPRGR